MSRIIAPLVRTAACAILISIVSVSTFAEVTLREALDFDGDGRVDYSVFRLSTGAWYVNGSTGAFIGQAWGNASDDRLVPGDYDGDGRGDLAVFREPDGVWHVLNSSNFTYVATHWGGDGDDAVGRDYDGDGKTDHAIVRRSGGAMTWWVLQSTGGFFSIQWGADSDFAVPGDYDGDGKFDFAVQRGGPTPTSQGIFYILGTQAGYFGVPWGSSVDFAVPGDYDGDGRTDVAVVREGATVADALTWYILRSDGQGYFAESFGGSGDDFTAQGDYDGDGRTDVAVWRQTNGVFYVKQSSDGSITASAWGGLGDRPVATYDTH